MKTKIHKSAALLAMLLVALAASAVASDNEPVEIVPPPPPAPPAPLAKAVPISKDQMFFRSVPFAGEKAFPKESTWLGVGVEESSEPLAAQLGLKPGAGLVVNFVSSNSPAAAAGLRKNDVLAELDGQMLVDPAQLQKLVQMHAEGESVKIQLYRAGKKLSVNPTLTKHAFERTSFNFKTSPNPFEKMQFLYNDELNKLDKEKLDVQIQQAVQLAQKAVQSALRESLDGTDGLNRKLEIIHKRLGHLADGGMNLSKDATVVVKNSSDSVRTMVKKDGSGTYVIVADPAKRLTVHNSDGKLLFDGAVESREQQEKVPRELWEKAESMLGQMDYDSAENSNATSRKDSESK